MCCGPGRGRRRFAAGRADAGMVTAELALALPTLIVVAAFAAFAVLVATARIRCIDTAAAVARMVARGEATGVVLARERALGPNSRVVVRRDGGLVRVEVGTRVPLLATSLPLPAATVVATITVADEAAPP